MRGFNELKTISPLYLYLLMPYQLLLSFAPNALNVDNIRNHDDHLDSVSRCYNATMYLRFLIMGSGLSYVFFAPCERFSFRLHFLYDRPRVLP